MQIDGFIDKGEFQNKSMNGLASFAKSNPLPARTAAHPSDPEREAEAVRSKEGIPLLEPVVEDLLEISKRGGYRLR